LIEILLYKQKDTNPHSQDEGRRSQVGGGSTRAEQPGLANTQHRLNRVVGRGGAGKGVSACLPNAYTSLHAGIHWEKRRLADGGRSLLQGTSISASAFGPTKKLFVSQHKDLSPAFPLSLDQLVSPCLCFPGCVGFANRHISIKITYWILTATDRKTPTKSKLSASRAVFVYRPRCCCL